MDMIYPDETMTSATKLKLSEGGYISILLLAVFALDTKHHALVTHLAHLGEPGLG